MTRMVHNELDVQNIRNYQNYFQQNPSSTTVTTFSDFKILLSFKNLNRPMIRFSVKYFPILKMLTSVFVLRVRYVFSLVGSLENAAGI